MDDEVCVEIERLILNPYKPNPDALGPISPHNHMVDTWPGNSYYLNDNYGITRILDEYEIKTNAEPHRCQKNAPGYCRGCSKCIQGYVSNPRCLCGALASWHYEPSCGEYQWKYYCNRCVSRGCSCNGPYKIYGPSGYTNSYNKYKTTRREQRNRPCCEYKFFRAPIRLRGKRKYNFLLLNYNPDVAQAYKNSTHFHRMARRLFDFKNPY